MKRRFHDALLGIVGLAGVAFFALSGASCEKTEMQCAVGHGPFIVKYDVVSGDAACYVGGLYEEIGFATYLQSKPKTETVQQASDGENITIVTSAGADYNSRRIAVQSTTFGGLLQERSGAGLKDTAVAYTFGDYTSNPDDEHICYAFGNGSATINTGELEADAFDTGEVDAMMNPIILPAFHYLQEWKNVRFYVTEGVPGTQVEGEMTFENRTAGEECTATYKFTGLYPAAHCIAEILIDSHDDDDMDAATPDDNDDDDPSKPDVPTTKVVREEPDDALCIPKAEEGWKKPDQLGVEYKAARITGSGINPDFSTKCDAATGYCILAGDSLIPKN